MSGSSSMSSSLSISLNACIDWFQVFRRRRTSGNADTSMKLHLYGTLNRLNVEHRTSNIEPPILMALCFIYLKQANRKISNDRFARAAHMPRVAQYFFKLTEY
jgi:hypothetical protein